jgi:hypothetical protein
MHRRLLLLALTLVVALSVGSSVALAGGGNSANAKACQKNGWMALQSSAGVSFADGSACVAYGAAGATLFGPSVTATDLGCVVPDVDGVLHDEWALNATGFTPNSPMFWDGFHSGTWVTDGSGSFTFHFIFDFGGVTLSSDFVDGNGVHASVTFGPSMSPPIKVREVRPKALTRSRSPGLRQAERSEKS